MDLVMVAVAEIARPDMQDAVPQTTNFYPRAWTLNIPAKLRARMEQYITKADRERDEWQQRFQGYETDPTSSEEDSFSDFTSPREKGKGHAKFAFNEGSGKSSTSSKDKGKDGDEKL